MGDQKNAPYNEHEHAKRMLGSLLRLPGNIDDVARRLISLAKMEGAEKECQYGDVLIRARADSTVESIRTYFEKQCTRRCMSSQLKSVR